MGILALIVLACAGGRYDPLVTFAASRVRASTASDMAIVSFVLGPTYAELAMNCIASSLLVGIRNHILVAITNDTFSSLSQNSGPDLRGALFEGILIPPTSKFAGGEDLRKALWQARWKAIFAMLASGLTVVHCDIDVVWLSNPLSFLRTIGGDLIASHGQSSKDWLFCMGWLLIRPTAAVRTWLKPAFFRMLAKEGDDQRSFNQVLLGLKWTTDPYRCTAPGYVDLVDCQERGKPVPTYSAIHAECRQLLVAKHRTGKLTVTLLPQRMIRRHGCKTLYQRCYSRRLSQNHTREFAPEQDRFAKLFAPSPRAGTEFALHCRDLDLGQTDLDQTSSPHVKQAALKSLGVWVRPKRQNEAGPPCDCSLLPSCPAESPPVKVSRRERVSVSALMCRQFCCDRNRVGKQSKLPGQDICQGPCEEDCWKVLNPLKAIERVAGVEYCVFGSLCREAEGEKNCWHSKRCPIHKGRGGHRPLDIPDPHVRLDTCGAGRHHITHQSGNICPRGWSHLTDVNSCRSAASELGLHANSRNDAFINKRSQLRPNGCFLWQSSGSVHFNTLTGSAPAGPIYGAAICSRE